MSVHVLLDVAATTVGVTTFIALAPFFPKIVFSKIASYPNLICKILGLYNFRRVARHWPSVMSAAHMIRERFSHHA